MILKILILQTIYFLNKSECFKVIPIVIVCPPCLHLDKLFRVGEKKQSEFLCLEFIHHAAHTCMLIFGLLLQICASLFPLLYVLGQSFLIRSDQNCMGGFFRNMSVLQIKDFCFYAADFRWGQAMYVLKKLPR